MKLYEANSLSKELIAKYVPGWHFHFDNSKSRFGCCHFGKQSISLSRQLVLLNPEETVKDTILHEIAHAMVGRLHGHDFKWRHTAMTIGCTGNRCFDHRAVKQPPKPWLAICGVCGKEYRSYRRHSQKCACRLCYNEHKDKAILTFVYVKPEEVQK